MAKKLEKSIVFRKSSKLGFGFQVYLYKVAKLFDTILRRGDRIVLRKDYVNLQVQFMFWEMSILIYG